MGTLQTAAEVTDSVYDSIMFTGAPGSGKTTAAAMFISDERKLILDIDDKFINTVRAIADEKLRNTILRNTDVWRPSYKTLSGDLHIGISRIERYDEKKKPIPGTKGYVPKDPKGYMEIVDFINELQEKPLPYTTVVLDPLTAVAEHLTFMILAHHQVSTFTQPLWGVYKQNLLEFTKGFLSLPAHRIIIVHETVREDERTEEVTVRPSIQGSYRDEIAKEFTEVYRFEGRRPSGKFMIRTSANGRYLGRTSKGLPMECAVEEMLAKYEHI